MASSDESPSTETAASFIYWLRLPLTHWILKSRLAEVNQFTGNYFRKVRIVSKNNFFEVNISRLTSLDPLSILLWPPGYADLRFIIAKRKIRGLLKASQGLNTCREYWEIFSLITFSFSGFSRPTESQPVCLSIFVHLVRQLDSQPANIWIGLIDNLSFSQSVHSRPFICRSDLESSNMSSFSSFDKDHLANICKFQRLLGAMRC